MVDNDRPLVRRRSSPVVKKGEGQRRDGLEEEERRYPEEEDAAAPPAPKDNDRPSKVRRWPLRAPSAAPFVPSVPYGCPYSCSCP